jgi:hypothetical protein
MKAMIIRKKLSEEERNSMDTETKKRPDIRQASVVILLSEKEKLFSD